MNICSLAAVKEGLDAVGDIYRVLLTVILLPLLSAFAALFVIDSVREMLRRRATSKVDRLLQNRTCLTCGYDLRASRERCPECGADIPQDGK